MSAPDHEAHTYPERKAMLERLARLEQTLRGTSGSTLVHATIAIETLRARLLGLTR